MIWAEVPASERANLFVRKLRLCAVICDFSEGAGNDRDKEIKRQARCIKTLIIFGYVETLLWLQTLLELVDYVNSAKQPFAEHIMPEVVNMVEHHEISLFNDFYMEFMITIFFTRFPQTSFVHFQPDLATPRSIPRRMSRFLRVLGRTFTLYMSSSFVLWCQAAQKLK